MSELKCLTSHFLSMPKASLRETQIIFYLYKTDNIYLTATDISTAIGIPKITTYQTLGKLVKGGYLDIAISPVDRIRRYRLNEKYRKWFISGESLGIDIFGSNKRTPEPKKA